MRCGIVSDRSSPDVILRVLCLPDIKNPSSLGAAAGVMFRNIRVARGKAFRSASMGLRSMLRL